MSYNLFPFFPSSNPLDSPVFFLYHNRYPMHWPRVIIAIVVGLIVVGAAAFPGIYYYNKYKDAAKKLERNPLLLEENNQGLIEEIGKLIDLPKDESPTIATVSDVEKLKNQPFFAKAKNGDKVLIYNTAKKAILYDPTGKKILEVGPLVAASPTPAGSIPAESSSTTTPAPTGTTPAVRGAATTPTPTPSVTKGKQVKVVLANGTTITGITSVVEKQLKEKATNVQVVDKRNAKKKDYAKTLVINLNSTNSDEATSIAGALEAEVSSLPAGEEKPTEGDILIIVGEDRK